MALATPADLADARSKLLAQSSSGQADVATMIDYLKLRRDLGVHEPEGVCEYGTYVLAKGSSRLKTNDCAPL
jgi:hypothetical protein